MKQYPKKVGFNLLAQVDGHPCQSCLHGEMRKQTAPRPLPPCFCRLGITKIVDKSRDTQCSLSFNLQQRHFFSKDDDAPRIRAIYLFLCSHSISNNKSLINQSTLHCCTRNVLCNLQNMLRVAAKRSPLNVFFITSNTTKK